MVHHLFVVSGALFTLSWSPLLKSVMTGKISTLASALQEDMENKKVDVSCFQNCGAGLRNVRIELTTSGL